MNSGSTAPATAAPADALRDDEADRACVFAVLNGHRDAFMDIVSRHQTRVHRFLLRHTQQRDDAEDLTQETFIQAYLKLAGWRGESKFSTWLIGVAINLARNHATRSPHLRHVHKELDDADGLPDLVDRHDPSEALAQSARHAAMEKAIARLPDELRLPLVLVAIDGVSYLEAAQLLGLASGTLKSRLNRARFQLREQLADHLPGSPK